MKWYCDDCATGKTPTQATPCPACCGFTAIDDQLRGEIGDAVVAINESALLDIARSLLPEFAERVKYLERVAAGDAS